MIRAPAPAPPVGYRPHMPLRVQLEAALIALGLEPKLVDFDHQPPLQLRIWCPIKQDTIPPANDPRHIVPRQRAAHRQESAKIVTPAVAKTRRLSAEQEELRRRLLAKAPGEERQRAGTIRSRGFDKTKRRRFDGSVTPRSEFEGWTG